MPLNLFHIFYSFLSKGVINYLAESRSFTEEISFIGLNYILIEWILYDINKALPHKISLGRASFFIYQGSLYLITISALLNTSME